MLPADGHVHSEWSWDARYGSMDQTCAEAVRMGLPAIAFTDHVDFTPFRAGHLADTFPGLVREGTLSAPQLDVAGYFECVERCRATYPDLHILTGMEVGQPHRHFAEVADLLTQAQFDRVIGSLHCLRVGSEFVEPFELLRTRPADVVMQEYLAEVARMISGSRLFTVLAHIDYPVRWWPTDSPQFDPYRFEAEFRRALRALAGSDRALEINTKVPLDPTLLRWWCDEGGRKITFASDAHESWVLGKGLPGAAAMANACGFRPDRKPEDPWFLSP
jgi:histidinol-phosphatase (PHP family)